MHITDSLTDGVVLTEIGERIAMHRLERGLTQASLADMAGISKRTLERVEAGDTAQISSIIGILRALGLFEGLETLVPATAPLPEGRMRKRVSAKQQIVAENDEWSWD